MLNKREMLEDNEKTALALHEALPRARTIDAWLGYSATMNLSDETIETNIRHIRALSTKKLNKLRKSLAAATRLRKLLPAEAFVQDSPDIADAPTDESGSAQPLIEDLRGTEDVAPKTQPQESEAETVQVETTEPNQTLNQPEEESTTDTGLQPEATKVQSVEVSNDEDSHLSEDGLIYARSVLGEDIVFNDFSVQEIAQRIYERAGSPKTYMRQGGGKIDPIKMLEHKLMGKDNGVIATLEGVSTSYTYQWFRKINIKINDRTPPLESEDLSSETASETYQPKPETEPSDQSLSSTPATHQPDSHEEQEQSTGIDFAELANDLPEEMKVEDAIDVLLQAGFSQDEVEALKVFTTFDEESRYRTRTDATKSALNRLQAILVEYKGTFKDEKSLSSLRMLTNNAFGPKNIEDVYYKLHGKDYKTQRSDVETIVRKGIVELAEDDR